MSDPLTSPDSTETSETKATMPSPLSCLGGSVVAGAIAVVLYRLTTAIALSFASKGIHSDNMTAQRIAAAVRTLVVGLSTLGTGIFALAALGLFGLGVQLLWQRQQGNSQSPGS